MSPIIRRSPGTEGAIDGPARLLGRVCAGLAMALVPAVLIVLLISWPKTSTVALARMGIAIDVAHVSTWRLVLACALVLVSVALMAVALWHASRCLAAFSRREYFSALAVHHLRRFSALVFFAGLAGVVMPTLAVLVLTTGGSGQASLSISLGSDDLFLLLFAGVSWQIARVLGRAVALAEDHAQIV